MKKTNNEKAREIGRNIGIHTDAYLGAMEMAKWKDEQFAAEKQQWIDKAMKVICDGCAQKAECEFNNWKTCYTKEELIKSMEE